MTELFYFWVNYPFKGTCLFYIQW